jgi:raffinose/stachyose/melibiose transport system substrate-binding protein
MLKLKDERRASMSVPSNRMSRRTFLKGTAAIVSVSALSACMPTPAAPAAAPAEQKAEEAPAPTAAPAAAEPIVINIDFRGYGPPSPGQEGASPDQGKALTALLAKYKEMHPNVTINHVPVDYGGMDSQQWTERRLVAKDGNDLLFGNWTYLCEKWMEAGLINFWTDYLEQPNPYVSGVNHWKDQFIMPSETQSNGEIAWLGLDNTTLWSFYNKSIFQEVGITPPKTWPEQIANYKKLAEKGYIPCADYHSLAYAIWTFDPVADQLLYNVFKDIAKGERREPLPAWVAQAVVDGKYAITMPEYQDSLKIATEWWQYMPEGAYSGGEDQGYQLFLSGKAASRFTGVWENANLNNDMPSAEKPFEWGTYPIPIIPKSMSQYATEKQSAAVFIAGFLLFQIPAYNSGAKLDQTADFLMYLSVPENLGTMLSEYKGLVPNIKNVPLPPSLADFAVNEDATFWYVNSWGATHINVQVRDAWVRNWQLLLLGEMTIDDYNKTMQPLLEEAAKQELANA